MDWTRIRNFIRKDTATSHFLQFLLHLLRNEICQAAISILGTIVIAIFIGKSRYDSWFIASCICYVLLVIGVALGNNYDKHERENSEQQRIEAQRKLQLVKASVDSIRVLNGVSGNGLYRIARQIKHDGWPSELKDLREVFGFQRVAFGVCEEIYNLLKNTYGLSKHYVTVYQRPEKHALAKGRKTKSICKMIAYGNSNHKEPLSYKTQYEIPDASNLPSEKNGIEFHTRLFAEGDTSPRILKTNREILENFKFHDTGYVREKKISQYIGIPSNVCNRGIMFLLQVDCEEEFGFGKTEEELHQFAETVLSQYVSLLALAYEIDRMNEVSTYYFSGIKRDC